MKTYAIEGKTYNTPPDPLALSTGTWSPMHLPDGSYNDAKFRELGGEITDDGTCWSKEELEFQALPCCTAFKAVCAQIAAFMGVETFLGGYDDILAFQQSAAAQANPVQALQLAMMWKGADDDCNYRAQKLGIGRPRWWYCCWDINPEESPVGGAVEEE